MANPEPVTGVLRSDVELIHGNPPLLFDRQADAYYKVAPELLGVLGYLTESIPVSEFQKKLEQNGIVLELETLLKLLAFLQQNNLLVPEYGHIGIKRERQVIQREKTAFLRFSAAYLFFKLPPWRPERLFEKIGPYVAWLASKKVIGILAIPAVLGYLLIIRDFSAVRTAFLDSLSWAGLAKYFLAILFLKLIHEAAHSLAAIHFHCRVRGIGIGFMVFYPRLYTDTTDSWRLPRRQRLLIDAAGIIIELLLGGIAALLWCYLPPGSGKSTMFYIFTVSTLSTLLVNGNPFIRYDGYYILCDLLNIENLMSRSSEYLKQFWRWHCLRLGRNPEYERGWLLLAFGICSFFYRIFLYTSIILLIYHKFVKAIAILMMFLELYSILIYPFWQELKTIRMLSKRSAGRARWILGGSLLLILAGVLFLPLSWQISLPGEIVPAEQRQIAVLEPGYLQEDLPRRAVPIIAGEVLFRLHSPQLESAIDQLCAVREYDRTLYKLQQLDEKNFSESRVTAEKLASDETGLQELLRRREALTTVAPATGFFVSKLPALSRGAYLSKGILAGEVVSERLIVYAYAPDRDIGKLNPGDTATVSLRDSLPVYPARIVTVNRIAAQLKDSPLLQHFGGPVPVYLTPGREHQYTSVLPLYRIELEFTEPVNLASGRVVTVKIRHSEQLGRQFWKLLLSIFRKEF